MREKWLTLPEAAKQLGVSTRTVRRWIHDGKIAAELRPGPYGHQYLVLVGQLDEGHLSRVVDATPAGAPGDEREALTLLREQGLRQSALLEALLAEVRGVRVELQRLRAAMERHGTES